MRTWCYKHPNVALVALIGLWLVLAQLTWWAAKQGGWWWLGAVACGIEGVITIGRIERQWRRT